MPAWRFTAPIAALGILIGVYIAFQLLQAFLTHIEGKPDPSLVQILSAMTPVLITVLYGIAATAHSRAENAEYRAGRIEESVKVIQNGGAPPTTTDGGTHGSTQQDSPSPGSPVGPIPPA